MAEWLKEGTFMGFRAGRENQEMHPRTSRHAELAARNA